MARLPSRLPWPPRFPDVVVHTTLAQRDGHPGYSSAKAGDADAALTLAIDLLDRTVVQTLRGSIAGPAILLPVIADETSGFNAIPDAMAQVLGRYLDLPVIAGEIVQTNKVGHTRAPAFQRLVTPAMFDGQVQCGAAYVLVDDHVGLGGTLANLRGYVEMRGGLVLAITTLTESRDANAFHCDLRREMCYGLAMATNSTSSGKPNSGMESTASPRSKPSSYVVSHPLPPSRVSWLRQQSRHVAEVSQRRFSQLHQG